MSDFLHRDLPQTASVPQECRDGSLHADGTPVPAPVASALVVPADHFQFPPATEKPKEDFQLSFSPKRFVRRLWTADFFGVSGKALATTVLGNPLTEKVEDVASVVITPVDTLAQGAAQMVKTAEEKIEEKTKSVVSTLLHGASVLGNQTANLYRSFMSKYERFKENGFSGPFRKSPRLATSYPPVSQVVSYEASPYKLSDLSYRRENYFEKALAWSRSVLSSVPTSSVAQQGTENQPFEKTPAVPESQPAYRAPVSPAFAVTSGLVPAATSTSQRSAVVDLPKPVLENFTTSTPITQEIKPPTEPVALPDVREIRVAALPLAEPAEKTRAVETKKADDKIVTHTGEQEPQSGPLLAQEQLELSGATTRLIADNNAAFAAGFSTEPASGPGEESVVSQGSDQGRFFATAESPSSVAVSLDRDPEANLAPRASAGDRDSEAESEKMRHSKRNDREDDLDSVSFFTLRCSASDAFCLPARPASPQQHAYDVAHSRDSERFILAGALMAQGRSFERRAERDILADAADFADSEAVHIKATVVNLGDLGHGHNSADQGPDWDMIRQGGKLSRQKTKPPITKVARSSSHAPLSRPDQVVVV